MTVAQPNRRGAIAALLALAALPALGADAMTPEQHLRVLSQLRGASYTALRDAMLAGGGDFVGMAGRHAADADWRVPLTAEILAAHVLQQPLFKAVAAELGRANPAAQAARMGGMTGLFDAFENLAFAQYGPAVLPVAWEAVTRFAAEAEEWITAAHLAMLSGQPDPRSARVAGDLIETSGSRFLRERAAYALSKLPEAAARAELARLEARSAATAEAVRAARDLMN